MPSRTRTLTKRVKYLRRQQEISKNAKRKARRVRTHKHNKSVKRNKKVMRGGKGTYTVYVLYDKIPTPQTIQDKYKWIKHIDVPICVIIFRPVNFSLDDIYLFFNNEAKSEDMLSMVKVLLGIKQNVDFSLNPPIETKEGTCKEGCFLKRTFIKLESCQSKLSIKRTYCVKSMDFNLWFDKTTTVEKLIDVEFDIRNIEDIIRERTHAIVTTDETYKDLNGKKIREQLEMKTSSTEYFRDGQSVFVNSVKESNACLPNLYKEFFKPTNPNAPTTDAEYSNDDYVVPFYKEYYTERDNEEQLPSKTDELYSNYRDRIKSKIVEDLKKRNNEYMLEPNLYSNLNLPKGRPLRISEPFTYVSHETHDAEIFVEAEWVLSDMNKRQNVSFDYFPVPSYFSYRKKWYVEEEKKETDRVKTEITQMQIDRYGQPPASTP